MKRTILAVGLLLQSVTAFGQTGIAFDTSFTSWNAVLQQAKKVNKPIFVDLYTTWCGPCKHMDRSIFPLQSVGDYYNTHFLCVKLDAEKGYGIEFNRKNNINAYPSFLFFTPSGEALRIDAGFREAPTFISIGQHVIQEYTSGSSLQSMKDKIKSGHYDEAFLAAYIKKLGHVKQTDIPAFEKYLSALPPDSLYSGTTRLFVETYYQGWIARSSLGFSVLLHAYKQYPIRDFELMKPWCIMDGRLRNNIDIAIGKKDFRSLEDIVGSYRQVDTEPYYFRLDSDYVYCYYYAGTGDSINFLKYLKDYIQDNITGEKDGKHRQEELKRYQAALKFKFGIDNPNLLSAKNNWFPKSYFCYYRLELNRLSDLEFQYINHLDKEEKYDSLFSKAMQASLRNYKLFSPNYNDFIYHSHAKQKL